jgi:hypothetical protein
MVRAMSHENSSDVTPQPVLVLKGRGATSNVQGRFAVETRERTFDGWNFNEDSISRIETEVVSEIEPPRVL